MLTKQQHNKRIVENWAPGQNQRVRFAAETEWNRHISEWPGKFWCVFSGIRKDSYNMSNEQLLPSFLLYSFSQLYIFRVLCKPMKLQIIQIKNMNQISVNNGSETNTMQHSCTLPPSKNYYKTSTSRCIRLYCHKCDYRQLFAQLAGPLSRVRCITRIFIRCASVHFCYRWLSVVLIRK